MKCKKYKIKITKKFVITFDDETQQSKRSLFVYHDAIYQLHTSQKWSFLVIYQNIYRMLRRFQYICIPSVYQKKPYTDSYTLFSNNDCILFCCFSVVSDQTLLVIFGHFCETKSFPLIKLVYVYQIFAYTNHIPNKIIFKNFRDLLLNLNYYSPYIIP